MVRMTPYLKSTNRQLNGLSNNSKMKVKIGWRIGASLFTLGSWNMDWMFLFLREIMNEKDKISSTNKIIVELLAKHQWIHNFQVTKFFIEKPWNHIPEEVNTLQVFMLNEEHCSSFNINTCNRLKSDVISEYWWYNIMYIMYIHTYILDFSFILYSSRSVRSSTLDIAAFLKVYNAILSQMSSAIFIACFYFDIVLISKF